MKRSLLVDRITELKAQIDRMELILRSTEDELELIREEYHWRCARLKEIDSVKPERTF